MENKSSCPWVPPAGSQNAVVSDVSWMLVTDRSKTTIEAAQVRLRAGTPVKRSKPVWS